MRVASALVAAVMDSLAGLGPVSTRAIFGGAGIFVEGRLVGVVVDDVLYMHADEANRDEYLSRGMKQFRPYPNVFNLTTDHYEVPADVVNDPQLLSEWGKRSLQAAIASAKAKQMAGIERVRKERMATKKK